MRLKAPRGRQQPWWLSAAVLAYVSLFVFTSAVPIGSNKGKSEVGTSSAENPFKPRVSFSNWISTFRQQRHEARRLRNIGPRPGEIEIKPAYIYSEQERKSLNMPSDNAPKPTQDERVANYNALTSRQKRLAYLLQTGHYEDPQEVERLNREEKEARDAAKAAAKRAPREAGSDIKPGATSVPGARTLPRTPSSDWDYKFMLKQAERSAQQGAQKVINALHVPRVSMHLRKRNPPQEWTNHGSIQYPGEGWTVVRAPRHPKQLQFIPFRPYYPKANIPKSFDELESNAQKEVLKTIPATKILRKHTWDLSKMDQTFQVSANLYDATGRYYTPKRAPHSISVRSKGNLFEFEYLHHGLFSSSRKWASFDKLPQHMKDFLKYHVSVDPTVTWARAIPPRVRKRSLTSTPPNSGQEGVSANGRVVLEYPGEKINIYWPRVGNHFFAFPSAARPNGITAFKQYNQLSKKEKQLIQKATGQESAEGLPAEQAGRQFKTMDMPGYARSAAVEIPGQEAENIGVSTRREFFRPWKKTTVFYRSRSVLGRFGLPTSFSWLPTRISDWIRQVHPEVLSNAAKSKLWKRSPPRPQELEHIDYPGESFIITKAPDGTLMFNFIHPTGNGIMRSQKWSKLPSEVRNSLRADNPNFETVATNRRLSVQQIEGQYDIRVATHIQDFSRSYYNPTRRPQRIQVWKHPDGRLEFGYNAGEALQRVSHSGLPSHLQRFVEGIPRIRDLLQAAASSSRGRRFRKRASKGEGSSLTMQTYYPGEGVIIRNSDLGYTFMEFNALDIPNANAGHGYLWHRLDSAAQRRIVNAIPQIKGVVRNRMHPNDVGITLKIPGARDDGRSTHFYQGQSPENIIATQTNDKTVFHRKEPGQEGRVIAGPSSFAELPSHLQQWVVSKMPNVRA